MSVKREIVIDSSPDFIRAAVLEDGHLCELHHEGRHQEKLTETLFYGRVQAIRPSVHAAFIDIGQEKNAFLPLDDHQSLKCGDMLIVQGAAKQTTQTKGLRVSVKISLAGKWLVLSPGESGVFISKKVKDTQLRRDLLELGQKICPPDCALIIRTASEEATPARMEEEVQILFKRWQDAQKRANGMRTPGVLLRQEPLDVRLTRDLAGPSLKRVITNDRMCYDNLVQAQKAERISAETTIERFEEKSTLLFDVFNLETQIDQALKKRIWLPCGGYLIFDFTEALTVIDVNSGKMIAGRDMEETALQVNQEAVEEIAHQLRLRDVGGMIIVDLIDMERSENREKIVSAMKSAVKADRSPVTVEEITKLGLLEMTRKRKGDQLRRVMQTDCSYCSGKGEVLSSDEVARRALRQVRRKALSGQRGPFAVLLAPNSAQTLAEMTQPEDCPLIYAVPVSGRHSERIEIKQLEAEEEPPKGALRLKATPNPLGE